MKKIEDLIDEVLDERHAEKEAFWKIRYSKLLKDIENTEEKLRELNQNMAKWTNLDLRNIEFHGNLEGAFSWEIKERV
jgi:hypothetical protein